MAYSRYPHLNRGDLVFVAGDDLWLAPLTGGRASRISSGEATPRNPRFSPDGSRIAFTSTTNGGWDCYVVEESSIRRLTWLSAGRMLVSGWLDAEHILLTSGHQANHRVDSAMYSLSLDGELTRLPWGAATSAAVSKGGKIAVASANFRDPSGWKRYRGGMAARLHVSADGASWKRVLPEVAASLVWPTWVGERLVFTADLGDAPDVQAQVWSVNAAGKDLRQHTSHTPTDGYVRDAAGDGQSLVYHARGKLYHLASLKAEPQPLEVTVPLGKPRQFSVEPTDRLEAIVPDQGGDASLVEWRGAAYLLTHRSGPARALADSSGVRVREPRFLGQSGKAVWVSDVDGEDCLEIRQVDGGDRSPRRIALGKLGRVLAMQPSPSGAKVAIGSHDGSLLLVDVSRGSVKKIGRSTNGEPSGLTWSPDARYLVWREAVGPEGGLGRLAGYDLATETGFTLTRGQFNDYSPTFSMDGKYLSFLSSRTIDPAYDEVNFDLSITNTIRPWVVPLSATEPIPFGPAADGWPLSDPSPGTEEKSEDKSEEQTTEESDPAIVLEVAGFEDRMVPLPVPSGRMVGLQATKNGLIWLSIKSWGELGSIRAGVAGEVKDQLEHFSFTTRKSAVIVEGCDGAAVTGDGERLLVRSSDEIWVQPSEQAVGEDDDLRVSVDLSRLRRELDPVAEWRQMFDENARIMRDHFWRSDFDGVDWDAAVARYRSLLPELAVYDDLIDLLWETVGELNTSHAYVDPVGGSEVTPVSFLGATYTRNSKGEVVVTSVLPGETSDPAARSPLRAAGVAVQPGDVIVAVDGRATGDVSDIGALLLGAAGKVVELTLARGRQKRRVAVIPTASEQAMRYHSWVASRVSYVREHSAGRIGYIHVPDMMASGWAEFQRLLEQAMRCDGVIVDVRFNGGGHTSELIIERIARRAIGWLGARHHDSATTYPSQARRGPAVFVTNPYAGSDGDMVMAAVQNLGLGPVVGERSWGGVIGIDGRFSLVDGTSVTQPRYWTAFDKQGFGLENHGVDPDIVVEMGPAEWEADTDVQLDAAIAEALRLLQNEPAATPPSFPAPRFLES